MNRITLAASALVLSTFSAFAQNAAPATAARPATPAPAASTAPVATPSATPSGSSRVAGTAAEARAAYTARIASREAACKAKGSTYTWTGPHNVGDPNPKGGFYATNSGGSCRQMTLKAAVEKGLVTVKGN